MSHADAAGMCPPAYVGLRTEVPGSVDTIILVDVDGVLNVGIREDKGTAPLLLNTANCEHAFRLLRDGALESGSAVDYGTRRSVERLVSVWNRRAPEEGGKTCGGFMCQAPSMLSPVLVDRLAQILRAAPGRCVTVLSSSWRKPSHARRVQELEATLSMRLGAPFAFGAATPPHDEHCAADRLRCIGSFLESVGASRSCSSADKRVRVLILEDFFISPPAAWSTAECPIDSVGAAEAWLRGRAPPHIDLSVKIIHTFEEWHTPGGLRVAMGSGLNAKAVRQATEYLQGVARRPGVGRQLLKAAFGSLGCRLPGGPAVQDRPVAVEAAKAPPSCFAGVPRVSARLWHLLATWPWLLTGSPVDIALRSLADDPAAPAAVECK